MNAADTGAYLRRLRIPDPGRPSVAGLRALQAAHVERIPYEALEIQLRRPTTIDPHDSARRILSRHRGGYCYHLNGAFSLLLDALGYDVVWHRAGVQNHADPEPVGAHVANHLTLTVHGLAAPECPSGDWLVDAGLGDALHEPLPRHEGTYEQGPMRFGIRPSDVEPGGWRLDHDPRGSFAGMDFRPARATTSDFLARHEFLSTSRRSSFVRTCSVQRRDAGGVDALTGCVLRRVGDAAVAPRTLETADEWFGALRDVFDLPLTDVDAAARAALWARVRAAHEAWLATSG
ncbi:MAG: N-hydroxyarylamine O-acetyltransferase [Solirubrobacteraceae bacterium]|nr:N-hydroxyarylamine O-acetyltransferase [Solirubrobacteraceae bacterium]